MGSGCPHRLRGKKLQNQKDAKKKARKKITGQGWKVRRADVSKQWPRKKFIYFFVPLFKKRQKEILPMWMVFVEFGFTRQETQKFETQKMSRQTDTGHGATNVVNFIRNHKHKEDKKQRTTKSKKNAVKKYYGCPCLTNPNREGWGQGSGKKSGWR